MDDWKQEISFFNSKLYKDIKLFLESERNSGKLILPSKDDIFNAFKFTRFNDVKVVILGQDPYPNPEHSMGLCFSIPEKCTNIPKSLQNIMKELKNDLGVSLNNGSLIKWAKQGVLLLNATLTLEQGKSNSHKGIGWRKLTKEVIQVLNEKKQHIVFILWGNFAQKLGKDIDRSRHFVIETPHPSPLSAYRGFFDSKPFSKTNKYLREHGIEEINWNN